MLDLLYALAEGNGQNPPAGNPLSQMLIMIVPLGLIIYFVMIRPQSRERKQREVMLSAMKKNDRVITIGGMLGTIVNLKDDEVTLKVDESNNTKITFSRAAIQRVLKSETPSE
jgi:preprotein translocase subunit YajC